MRVTVITAHADDMEISCAGTLLAMQAQGHEITSVITVKPMRSARANRTQQVVLNEIQESYRISGFRNIVFETDIGQNERPDLRFDNHTMTRLSEILEPCDLAILPNPQDSHQDHQNTFHLAYPIMLRRARSIWCMNNPYYSHNYEKTDANLLRDISEHWPKKLDMIRCYSSYFDDKAIEIVEQHARWWGIHNRTDMAEAFSVVLDRG